MKSSILANFLLYSESKLSIMNVGSLMRKWLINICAIIGIFSIIFIIIPIITGIVISVDGPKWLETNNEWIGYWGGYAGAIIGGLVTLYVMRETNKEAIIETSSTNKELHKKL